MPSIPQSLLWISLVVLWLFVLVPMLISKRETVRRTSDVALATRVLNTGSGARLLRRRKPAAGHHSDPHWRPTHDDLDEYDDHGHDDEPTTAPRKTVVVMAAAKVETESEYLDVDVVEEDSGALPIGVSGAAGLRPGARAATGIRREHRRRSRSTICKRSTTPRSRPTIDATPTTRMTDEFAAVSRTTRTTTTSTSTTRRAWRRRQTPTSTSRERSHRNAAGSTSRRPPPR